MAFWLPCKAEVLVIYQQHYLNCRHLPKKVEYSMSAVLRTPCMIWNWEWEWLDEIRLTLLEKTLNNDTCKINFELRDCLSLPTRFAISRLALMEWDDLGKHIFQNLWAPELWSSLPAYSQSWTVKSLSREGCDYVPFIEHVAEFCLFPLVAQYASCLEHFMHSILAQLCPSPAYSLHSLLP